MLVIILLRYILVSIYRRMNIRAPHGIFPISTLLFGKEGKNSQLVRPAKLKDDNNLPINKYVKKSQWRRMLFSRLVHY
jgi:hypothetical protein